MAHKIRAAKSQPPAPPSESAPIYYMPPLQPPRPARNNSALLTIIAFVVAVILLVALFMPASTPKTRYVEFEVDYGGRWDGLLMIGTEQDSFATQGPLRFGLNVSVGTYYYISAQKMDWGYDALTLRVYSNGEIVKSAFTNAEFGIASAYWTVS